MDTRKSNRKGIVEMTLTDEDLKTLDIDVAPRYKPTKQTLY